MSLSTVGGSSLLSRTGSPVIDYTSLDFAAIKEDLRKYAQATFSDRWTDFNPSHFAVVFLDLISYLGDLLTFNLNAAIREVTATTCQRRQHLSDIAKSYDYQLASAGSSSGVVRVNVNAANLPMAIVAATQQWSAGDVVFQPSQDMTLTAVASPIAINNGDGTWDFLINVIEGEQLTDITLGVSDGTREQSFALTKTPLLDNTLVVKVNGSAWTKLTTFTNSGPTDIDFIAETNDDDNTTIFFGDNVNGKIPPLGQTITGTWKAGGGRRGNVGVDTVTSITTPITGMNSVTNEAIMTGGSDRETLSHARSALPKSIVAGDRAVSITDYAIIAKKTSTSVQKASARFSQDAVVEIAIVPSGGGFPTDTLKGAVSTYVSARKTVGQRIRVINPTYINIAVAVDAYVDPSSDKALAKQRVSDMFLTADSTDVQDAIFDLTNVGFGARDDDHMAQLTIQRVYDLLNELKAVGIQSTRLISFTTSPTAVPVGVVSGNGLFTFTTTDTGVKKRRQWRVVFTAPTTYTVYERVFGTITSINKDVLTDDRGGFPTFPTGALLNPNSTQASTFGVDVSGSTPITVKRVASSGTLLTVANVGDSYYVEWIATPSGGTVGATYTPTGSGLSWNFAAGTTAFVAGDEFIVTVFAEVDDLLLPSDQVPVLLAGNLTVNVRTAL